MTERGSFSPRSFDAGGFSIPADTLRRRSPDLSKSTISEEQLRADNLERTTVYNNLAQGFSREGQEAIKGLEPDLAYTVRKTEAGQQDLLEFIRQRLTKLGQGFGFN